MIQIWRTTSCRYIWSEPCILLIHCTQLHSVWSLLLFSEMHIRQKFQWTSAQSVYLGLEYFHPNFLQNIFLCCWNVYSLFIAIIPSVQYFGQQLLFKCKYCRVVPIHSHLYWNLKREVSRSYKEFKIVIVFWQCSTEHSLFQAFYYLNTWNRLQRRKEWICESKRQVSDRLHFFAQYFDLNPYPSTTTVYARSAFCTRPAFYSQSAVCILHSVWHFTPGVQCAVCGLHFTLTGFPSIQYLPVLFYFLCH